MVYLGEAIFSESFSPERLHEDIVKSYPALLPVLFPFLHLIVLMSPAFLQLPLSLQYHYLQFFTLSLPLLPHPPYSTPSQTPNPPSTAPPPIFNHASIAPPLNLNHPTAPPPILHPHSNAPPLILHHPFTAPPSISHLQSPCTSSSNTFLVRGCQSLCNLPRHPLLSSLQYTPMHHLPSAPHLQRFPPNNRSLDILIDFLTSLNHDHMKTFFLTGDFIINFMSSSPLLNQTL